MSAENHVAGVICGSDIWVRGQVVEELVHGNICGFSGCGLLGAQGAEGGKEFVVASPCIIEESANEYLEFFRHLLWREEGCRDRHGLVVWFGQR